jgi:hypothetical protein
MDKDFSCDLIRHTNILFCIELSSSNNVYLVVVCFYIRKYAVISFEKRNINQKTKM